MVPTIRFVMITALRDRLFVSLLALTAVVFGLSIFLGSSAIAESRQMTVVYAAGGIRLLLVLGLTVFTAFHLERLYENREIETLLSRAITRESFVFSYWTAMAIVTLLMLAPACVALYLFQMSSSGMFFWVLTLVLECFVIVAFAMFCVMTMERAIPTIFATVGFYVLARLIGFFTGIAEFGLQQGVNRVTNPVMDMISYIVPRLDLAAQTRWLVYGIDEAKIILILSAQCLLYIALLLGGCMFDLRRKHF